MPTPTYVAIAKTVLTGTQVTVTFSAIDQTYTDLLLMLSLRTNKSATVDELAVQFNSLAVGNYSNTSLYGYTTSANSQRQTRSANLFIVNNYNTGDTATASSFANMELYIPNYAGSSLKVLSANFAAENNSTSTGNAVGGNAGLANLTAAITSISLTNNGGASFVSGSRFDLYGIKNS